MWKKLSTPPAPPVVPFEFHDVGPRGGQKPGEMLVFMGNSFVGEPVEWKEGDCVEVKVLKSR